MNRKTRKNLRITTIILSVAMITLLSSCDFLTTLVGANISPVADAGEDQTVELGLIVELDGGNSSDADGDNIEYLWELVSFPTASALRSDSITGQANVRASFSPDVVGIYDVRLLVSDRFDTVTDSVRITVVEGTSSNLVSITDSSHPEGATDASVSGTLIFYFSENMTWSSFENQVFISREGDTTEYIATATGNDPNLQAIGFLVPANQRTADNKLYGNEQYTVRFATGIRNAAGDNISEEIIHSFTTFEYGQVYDDSAFMDGDTWGLVYHEASNSLFYDGENVGTPVVRRLDLDTLSPTTELTYTGGQVMYGGVDLYGDTLYVNRTYDSQVAVHPINPDGTLAAAAATYSATTLAAPADSLSEVIDTAVIGSSLYFTTGNFHGGSSFTDIIQYDGTSWSVFRDASVQGFDFDEDAHIVAVDNASGADFIYLASPSADTLYRFSTAGDNLSIDFQVGWNSDLAVDSDGNLFVIGSDGGIYKFDAALNLISQREGLGAGRLAVRDLAVGERVYFLEYRDPAVIEYVDF